MTLSDQTTSFRHRRRRHCSGLDLRRD